MVSWRVMNPSRELAQNVYCIIFKPLSEKIMVLNSKKTAVVGFLFQTLKVSLFIKKNTVPF